MDLLYLIDGIILQFTKGDEVLSNKEKKPNEATLAKQAIATLYQKETNSTPIIVAINLEKFENGYAAITSEHIKCFKYDKALNDVISIATYSLQDYTNATVDHFAIKSVFHFKGLHQNFTFVPTEKGKDIESFIKTNTPIQFEYVQRKWYQKILGFRSGKRWKMVVACLLYITVIGTIGNLISGKDDSGTAQPTSAETDKPREEIIENAQKEEKEKAAEEKKEREKEEKTAAPTEKQPAPLEEKLNKITQNKVGKKNVESIKLNDNLGTEAPNDKIALITLSGKDNLTSNMIKKGMWKDTSDMLKDIAKEKDISEVVFFWKFELEDTYGNKKNENVMKITYNRETIDKINFDNFSFNNIPTTANQYWQHPAVEKK